MGLQVLNGTVTGENPYDDEGSAVAVYGSPGRVLFQDLSLTGAYDVGITSYSSDVSINGLDLGSNGDTGMQTKHGGQIVNRNGDITGSVRKIATAEDGFISIKEPASASHADQTPYAADNGFVIGPKRMVGARGMVNDHEVITLSSGAVDDPPGYVRVRAESGSTDTLEQITGVPPGAEITIEPHPDDTITVAHDALATATDGAIFLNGQSDFTMDSPRDKLHLLREQVGGEGIFSEIGRGNNG
jgi:hypothetical protein